MIIVMKMTTSKLAKKLYFSNSRLGDPVALTIGQRGKCSLGTIGKH